jgi:uncharacterized protein
MCSQAHSERMHGGVGEFKTIHISPDVDFWIQGVGDLAREEDVPDPLAGFHTAEPILAEAAAVLESADEVLRMVETGDLVLSLDLAAEVSSLRSLLHKYRDPRMDLGDACCVRLAEMLPGGVVYTVDQRDFSIYRKSNRQPVPCIFPD